MNAKQSKTLMLTIMVPCADDLPPHVQAFIRQNLQQHIEQEFNVDYDPTWVKPAWTGPPVTGAVVILSKVIDTTTHTLLQPVTERGPREVGGTVVIDMSPPPPVDLAATIARHFLRLLREDIGPDNYAEACVRNARETNDSICHSHDFCDANMTMQAAFGAVGRVAEVDDDADLELWGAAWALAFKTMVQQAGGQ